MLVSVALPAFQAQVAVHTKTRVRSEQSVTQATWANEWEAIQQGSVEVCSQMTKRRTWLWPVLDAVSCSVAVR